MQVKMKLSRGDERSLLVKTVERMRKLRHATLAACAVSPDRTKEYLTRMVEAASFADSIDMPQKTEALKTVIANKYNDDPALRGYDCSQESWWTQCQGYDRFLRALRMFTIYLMRGGVVGPEDTFHIFQYMKYRYADNEERKKDDFIRPAYGGLQLPQNMIAALVSTIARNNTLSIREGPDRLILRLNWYPDDKTEGIEETKRILEAAKLLGYYGIEFLMPSQLKYEQLRAYFEEKLKFREEDNKIFGILRTSQNSSGKPDVLMQAIETGDRDIAKIPDYELAERERTHYAENGLIVLASADDVGMGIERMLFSMRQGESMVSGGIYTEQEGTGKELAVQIARDLIELRSISVDGLNKLLSAAQDRVKAVFTYAILKITEHGLKDEIELEAMEQELGGVENEE